VLRVWKTLASAEGASPTLGFPPFPPFGGHDLEYYAELHAVRDYTWVVPTELNRCAHRDIDIEVAQ